MNKVARFPLQYRIYYLLRQYRGIPLSTTEIRKALSPLNCKSYHLTQVLYKLSTIGLIKKYTVESGYYKYELVVDDITEWKSYPNYYLEFMRRKKNGKEDN